MELNSKFIRRKRKVVWAPRASAPVLAEQDKKGMLASAQDQDHFVQPCEWWCESGWAPRPPQNVKLGTFAS